jgi:subtilisin-like proprotein convertase family protein
LYPSPVDVSGIGAGEFKVTATVRRMSHTFAADIDMLLVGPTGATVMLMSDVGRGSDLNVATLTFDDDAAGIVAPPALGADIPSGTYKPSPDEIEPDVMPAPAPNGPYGSSFTAFTGTNPNGTWRLFVVDDLTGDIGGIGEGWCINITTASTNVPPSANAGGPYAGDEGSPITFDGSGSSDPDNTIVSYAWDFGDGSTGSGANPEHAYADNGTYPVTVTVTADDGSTSSATSTTTVANAAPQVTGITLHPVPVAVGTPITISASFTDVGTADTHTASWDLGPSGAIASGTVVEANGSGIATATVTYAQAGVYTISASVTDDDNATGTRSSATSLPAYVVVYDPTAGYVTGGGWITSPAGSYTANPSLTGQAAFGFVAKYLIGSSVPTGNTQFHFRVGDLRFSSTSYDYLVVAAAKSKYKGEGTINGVGRYGFMVTAIDGDAKETPGPDAFRMRIWNLATGAVVYDNMAGAIEDSYSALAIAGGSITVHK